MNTTAKLNQARSSWQKIVESHVDSLRFGVVQIVVHDSRVVQIERTEKVRLTSSEATSSAEEFKATQTTGSQS